MDRFKLRLKLSLDGRRAYLLAGSVREVSITWSDKNNAFNVFFRSKLNEAEWTRTPAFVDFFAELLTLIEAYKKEADALEKCRQALELIVNQ